MTPPELAKLVLSGDTLAAARACRWVDDQPAGYRALISALTSQESPAFVIGLTGSPGVGKSTLADALIARLRQRGERVGVVAIDPVSPFSGGALLGDRVRMQRHANDPDVFVRSLSTRGAMGGLSRSADATVLVLSAWGARVVVLETVGVGQDEIDVCRSADTTLVVSAPGFGDGVQALKAGLLEVADVLVANKADRPGADALVSELESAVALGVGRVGSGAVFVPRIVRTVANTGHGVEGLLDAIEAHRGWLLTPPGSQRRTERRREHTRRLLWSLVTTELERAFGPEFEAAAGEVVLGSTDAFTASERLLERVLGPRSA
jgi:LAO/AO transport system kinase